MERGGGYQPDVTEEDKQKLIEYFREVNKATTYDQDTRSVATHTHTRSLWCVHSQYNRVIVLCVCVLYDGRELAVTAG